MSGPVISSKDVIELSKSQGFLAKQVYVIFTTPIDGMGPVMANLQDHLAFQTSLEKRGIMVAAGPHWTDDQERWEGDGMVVIRAGSLAEANAIAAEDPMHARGARRFRVRPWFVNEGTLSIKLDFSSGRFSLD